MQDKCIYYIILILNKNTINQWRNKVAVGPRASIPKGPPLPRQYDVNRNNFRFMPFHTDKIINPAR